MQSTVVTGPTLHSFWHGNTASLTLLWPFRWYQRRYHLYPKFSDNPSVLHLTCDGSSSMASSRIELGVCREILMLRPLLAELLLCTKLQCRGSTMSLQHDFPPLIDPQQVSGRLQSRCSLRQPTHMVAAAVDFFGNNDGVLGEFLAVCQPAKTQCCHREKLETVRKSSSA